MRISRFARGVRKAGSSIYKDDANGMKIIGIERDNLVGTTLKYCGSTSESEMRYCKAMGKHKCAIEKQKIGN